MEHYYNPPHTHNETYQSTVDFEFTKDSRNMELTLRDPSFPNMEYNPHQYSKKHDLPQQLTYNTTTSTKFSTRVETQHSDHNSAPNDHEKTIKSAQNRKKSSIFSMDSHSKPPYLSTGKFNEAKHFGSERKSSRTDLSSERLSTKRSAHSRSPSDKPLNSNEQRSAKPKTFSVGNLKDVMKMPTPSGPSTAITSAVTSERTMMASMKREMDELRAKLQNKEKELADNLRYIEEIHQNMRQRGQGTIQEFAMVQQLREKAKKLEEENAELRETLRNEIMASETQRSQMEIVRDALENKLESMGILAEKARSSGRADILVEYDQLLKKFENADNEIATLTERLSNLQGRMQQLEEENNHLSSNLHEADDERKKLADDIQNGIRVLQTTREEQRKLEEEKSNLIEYLNNKLAEEEAINEERQKLNEELENLRAQNQEFEKKLDELAQEYERARKDVTVLEKERQKILNLSQDLMKQKEIVDEKRYELEQECAYLREDRERLEQEAGFHQEELELLRKNRREYEDKLSKAYGEVETLKLKVYGLENQKTFELAQEKVISEEAMKHYEERFQGLLQENTDLQGHLDNLDFEHKRALGQLEEVTMKNSRLEEKIAELEKELTERNERADLKNDEVRHLQNLLETKEKEVGMLHAQNRKFKSEYEMLQDNHAGTTKQLEKLVQELDFKSKENENFRAMTTNLQQELSELRHANQTISKEMSKKDKNLYEYENKISSTLSCIKNFETAVYGVEADNNALRTENDELREEVDNLKEKIQHLTRELNQFKERKVSVDRNISDLHKDIEELSEENERLSNENERLASENRGFKEREDLFSGLVEEFVSILNAFVEDLNKNTSTAGNFLSNCTIKMKEMLTTSFVRLRSDDFKRDYKKACGFLQEWLLLLLEEVEKDVLRIYRMKEEAKVMKKENDDLRSQAQSSVETERKNQDRCQEYKNQMETLRQEKKELQERIICLQDTEGRYEKEIAKLKQQGTHLNTMVDELKDINSQLRQALEDAKAESSNNKALLEADGQSNKNAEAQYQVLTREKKQLEDLLELISSSIASPDHSKLIKDLIELQYEINRAEKESIELENNLLEKETELKASLKKGSKSSSEIVEMRKEVEKLRQEYQNAQTQITIFTKRRKLLQEELIQVERMERRRYEYALDLEKNLAKYRDEAAEFKLRNEDLSQINATLQSKIKEMAENNYILQTENYSSSNRPPIHVRSSLGHLSQYQSEAFSSFERATPTPFQSISGRKEEYALKPSRSANQLSQSPIQTNSLGERKSVKKISFQPTDVSHEIIKQQENDEKQIMHALNGPKQKLKDKILEARSMIHGMKGMNKENYEY